MLPIHAWLQTPLEGRFVYVLPRGILVDTLLLTVIADVCNRIPITTHLTQKAIVPFDVVLKYPTSFASKTFGT